jgi:hypothetical protein
LPATPRESEVRELRGWSPICGCDRPTGSSQRATARTFDGSPAEALLLTWLDVRDPCNCLPPSAASVARRFGDGVELAAWQATRQGDELGLTLFWRANAIPAQSYTTFIHVLRGEAVIAQVDDQPNAGRRATSAWRPGELIRDHHQIRASGATHGRVGMYTPRGRLPLDPPTPDNALTLVLPPGG